DLNYPARVATLAVAGLPMIQADNTGSIVATQTLTADRGLGVAFASIEDLAAQLHDRPRLDAIRESVWAQRADFTFDAHADRLLDFLRSVTAR
ncbi:MAG: glycosyltransferase family 2 protein, partial [Thermomicrobiales bacterium]